jgi:nucleotidyltransferase AbiEii toxin of type IV toxin-antitoxin system
MVALRIANSRMKGFYDIWVLARRFTFEGDLLCQAIQATFARRGTPLPAGPPVALTPAFSQDKDKRTQ